LASAKAHDFLEIRRKGTEGGLDFELNTWTVYDLELPRDNLGTLNERQGTLVNVRTRYDRSDSSLYGA